MMIRKGCLLLKEQMKLSLSHGLNDELSIVTEEEEASTTAWPCPCLEDLLLIILGIQWGIDLMEVLIEFLESVKHK